MLDASISTCVMHKAGFLERVWADMHVPTYTVLRGHDVKKKKAEQAALAKRRSLVMMGLASLGFSVCLGDDSSLDLFDFA